MRWRGVVGIVAAVAAVAAVGGCGGGGGGSGDLTSAKLNVAAVPRVAAVATDGSAVSPEDGQVVATKLDGGGALRPLALSAFQRDMSFTLFTAAEGHYTLRLDLAGQRYEMLDGIGTSLSGSLTPDPDEEGTWRMATVGRLVGARLRVRDGLVVGLFPFVNTYAGYRSFVHRPFVGVTRWQDDPARIDGIYNRFEVSRTEQGKSQANLVQVRIANAGTLLEECIAPQPAAVTACPAGALKRSTLVREGDGWRATDMADANNQQRFSIGLAGGESVWLASRNDTTGPWLLQVGVPAVDNPQRVRALGGVTPESWGTAVGGDNLWQASWPLHPQQSAGVVWSARPVLGMAGVQLAASEVYSAHSRMLALSFQIPSAFWMTPGRLSIGLVDVPVPRPAGDPAGVTYQYKAGERVIARSVNLDVAVDTSALFGELAAPGFEGYLPFGYQPFVASPADLYANYERKSNVGAYEFRWSREAAFSDDNYYAQANQGFDRAWSAALNTINGQTVLDVLYTRPAGSTRRFVHTSVPSAFGGVSAFMSALNQAGARGYCSSAGPLWPGLSEDVLRREATATSRCEYVVLDMPATWVKLLAQINAQGAAGFVPAMSLAVDYPRQVYVRDVTQASSFAFYEIEMPVGAVVPTASDLATQDAQRLAVLNREGALGGRRYTLNASYVDRLPSRQLFMLARSCSGALCP